MSTCKRMWTDRQIYSMADQKAKERIEAGQTSNAKPIYWHSCNLKRVSSGTLLIYLDFIIVNNSQTPITKESLLAWLNDNPDVEIKVVQGYSAAQSSNLVSFFKLDTVNPTTNIVVSTIKLSDGEVESSDYNITTSETTLTDVGGDKLN